MAMLVITRGYHIPSCLDRKWGCSTQPRQKSPRAWHKTRIRFRSFSYNAGSLGGLGCHPFHVQTPGLVTLLPRVMGPTSLKSEKISANQAAMARFWDWLQGDLFQVVQAKDGLHLSVINRCEPSAIASYPLVHWHWPWQIGVGRLVSTIIWWFSGSMFIYQRVSPILTHEWQPGGRYLAPPTWTATIHSFKWPRD